MYVWLQYAYIPYRPVAIAYQLYQLLSKTKDVNKAVTMDVKNTGDLVYVLGTTKDELGGSEYYNELGFIGNNVPKVDQETAKKLYFALHEFKKTRSKIISTIGFQLSF